MLPHFPYKRVLFVKAALEYPLGGRSGSAVDLQLETIQLKGSRVTGIPGKTPRESYFQGKQTLVVSVRWDLSLLPCKPSAHFQLPLVSAAARECANTATCRPRWEKGLIPGCMSTSRRF